MSSTPVIGIALEGPIRVGKPRQLRPNVLVGLGNEIAGDDGVGIRAAQAARARLGTNPDIEVVEMPWAGLALLDILRGRRRAAIVDCLTSGHHRPGAIVRLDEHHLAGSVRLNSFHDIAFPTALALGRRMGWELPGTIRIWAVEAGRADEFGERLSRPVSAAIEPLVAEVVAFLRTGPGSLQEVGAA